jgi:hypothetical protein
MRRSSKPLPKDSNQRAYEIFRLSVEESDEKTPTPKDKEQPPEKSEISKYLAEIGRKGGLKGGNARAAKLSARKRKEIAQKAAKSRWNRSK